MVTNPIVSVIIPNYNHARYLTQRISTIINQSFDQYELIILDDASSDNSRAILKQYENHPKVSHYIFNNFNSGSVFSQWKKGIKLCRGEYIWIAESDDYSDLNFLRTTVEILQKDKDIGIVHTSSFIDYEGKYKEFNSYLESIHNTTVPVEGKHNGIFFVEKYLLNSCSIPNVSSCLIRRTCIMSFLNNIDKYRFYGDWYLYLNILKNHNIYFINKSLNFFRKVNGSVSSTIYKSQYIKERIEILKLQKRITGYDKVKEQVSKLYYIIYAEGHIHKTYFHLLNLLFMDKFFFSNIWYAFIKNNIFK